MNLEMRNELIKSFVRDSHLILSRNSRGEKELINISIGAIMNTRCLLVFHEYYTAKNTFKNKKFLQAIEYNEENLVSLVEGLEKFVNDGFEHLDYIFYKSLFYKYNLEKNIKMNNMFSSNKLATKKPVPKNIDN